MVKKTRKRQGKQSILGTIERLIILQLIRDGAGSDEIGEALGVDSSVIRHAMSINKIRKISSRNRCQSK